MAQAAVGKSRPKYLNLPALLFEIRLPLPGWLSILHRVSGVLLFIGIVWLLYLLDRSLASPEGFDSVRGYLKLVPVKLALLVLIWSYCHHFCAGIRYLFLDMHKGLDLRTARMTAAAVFVVSLALTVFFGVKIW